MNISYHRRFRTISIFSFANICSLNNRLPSETYLTYAVFSTLLLEAHFFHPCGKSSADRRPTVHLSEMKGHSYAYRYLSIPASQTHLQYQSSQVRFTCFYPTSKSLTLLHGISCANVKVNCRQDEVGQ